MSGERDLFETEDEAREARARHEFGNPFADAPALAQAKGKAGRPKGALNLKTRDFERYYAAMGYRDPLKAMAEWLTADPVALVAWFEKHETRKKGRPSLFQIVHEQHQIAVALAPYLHGKKPVEVQIIDERLPTLIVDLGTNQLDEARQLAAQRALSVGSPVTIEHDDQAEGEASDFNDLGGDE